MPLRPRGAPAARIVDTLVGVPLLALASVLRRGRTLPSRVETVVVVSSPAIGDTLLAGALVHPLRRRWPDARIVLASFPPSRPAATLLDGVDELVPLELLHPLRSVARIREVDPEIVVDATPWPKLPALLASLAGAWCVGFRRRDHLRHLAFDAWVEHRDDRHELENHRALLGALGVEADGALPAFRLPPVPDLRPSRPFAVLHPWASGSGKRLKEWPFESWAAVAAWARSRGWDVVLTGGPDDREDSEALAEHLRGAGVDHVHDLAGRITLGETAALLQEAEIVVAVNTGTMHLAAFLGCPVVGLHGPTDPLRWGPVGPRARVAGPAEGGGFLSLGYEYRDAPGDTMRRLPAAEVLARAEELVGGGG